MLGYGFKTYWVIQRLSSRPYIMVQVVWRWSTACLGTCIVVSCAYTDAFPFRADIYRNSVVTMDSALYLDWPEGLIHIHRVNWKRIYNKSKYHIVTDFKLIYNHIKATTQVQILDTLYSSGSTRSSWVKLYFPAVISSVSFFSAGLMPVLEVWVVFDF